MASRIRDRICFALPITVVGEALVQGNPLMAVRIVQRKAADTDCSPQIAHPNQLARHAAAGTPVDMADNRDCSCSDSA